MAIEQWEFFNEPHLLRNGHTLYNGHLRGPLTPTPVAERLAVELSLPVFTTQVCRYQGSNPDLPRGERSTSTPPRRLPFQRIVFSFVVPEHTFLKFIPFFHFLQFIFCTGDSIESHGTTNTNGNKFTTRDVDNDFAPSSCAVARKGAWWHNVCTWANLNGIYGYTGNCVIYGYCNFWYSLTSSFAGVKTSYLMIRRV